MKLEVIFIISFATFVFSLPLGGHVSDSALRIGTNDLFQQLNDILKREINKEIKNDSLEIGDKYKGDDGNIQISINKFSTSNGFPLSFNPSSDEVLDNKEIVTWSNNNSEGSSGFILQKTSSNEDSKEDSEEKLPETKKENSEENSSEESTTQAKVIETSSKGATTTSIATSTSASTSTASTKRAATTANSNASSASASNKSDTTNSTTTVKSDSTTTSSIKPEVTKSTSQN